MDSAEHQILTRISFAERWLQRAREECLDGDVGRGLLTLVLADAEVRRLLQLAVPAAPPSRRAVGPAVAVAAGLLIAALTALQLGVLALRAPVESAALPPGLSLRAGTGALLERVEGSATATVAVRPDTRRTVNIPVSWGTPVRSVRVSTPAVKPSPARTAPAASVIPAPQSGGRAAPVPQPVPTHAPAAPSSAPPAPVVAPADTPEAQLSLADMLDLVIVADRTLRRSQP